MKSGIYLIINTVTGKLYIGSSKKLWDRWRNHRSDLRAGKHTNCHLQSAWAKDGEQAFQFSVLEYCLAAELLEREDWWIELLCTRKSEKGYNFWTARRHECSPETREKLAVAHRGDRNHFFGKKHSAESLARMSSIKKGKHHSRETRSKLSKAAKGRKCEWGHKIAAAKRGHEVTAETRARISASKSGKPSPCKGRKFGPMSEEQRAVRAKVYHLTSPTGETLTVHNLTEFCRQNELNAGRLFQVAKGKEPHYKQWRAVPA